jgi:hypothetical protein
VGGAGQRQRLAGHVRRLYLDALMRLGSPATLSAWELACTQRMAQWLRTQTDTDAVAAATTAAVLTRLPASVIAAPPPAPCPVCQATVRGVT